MDEGSGAFGRARGRPRTRRAWRVGGLAALATATVLALAACDGGQGTGDAASAPATTGDPPTTASPSTKPPATTRPPAERVPVLSGGKASKSDIRWVQRRLGQVHPDLKAMVGKVDGRMGPQTRQALCVYRTVMQGCPPACGSRSATPT